MDINNLMKSVELEQEFRVAANEVSDILARVQMYVLYLEEKYKGREKNDDFIAEMQMRQATLLRLVNHLNDIAMQAMAINEQSLVFRIEDVKRQVRDTMEYVRNLYM